MRRLFNLILILAAIGAAGFFWLTRPGSDDIWSLAGLEGDAERGRLVFAAAGCASCHSAADATGEARLLLVGGRRFASDFGTFVAPNISTDPTAGIGAWNLADFANAVRRGVSPEGRHYYPAFPYAAYRNMTDGNLVDLWAFIQTLPASTEPSPRHELAFPFNYRRGLGLWKLAFAQGDWVLAGDLSEEEARGRYLVEALAHCGECHSPRNLAGGIDRQRWLGGAPNPSGRGTIPNITPAELDWDAFGIAEYLQTGFTPDFDTVGGSMADVVEELSSLPREDLDAIAAYLLAVPAVMNP